MAELHHVNIPIPLPARTEIIIKAARAAMDGYHPMTGAAHAELIYLLTDGEPEIMLPGVVLSAMRGIVFEHTPQNCDVKDHVLAEGFMYPCIYVDIWQEEK